MNLRYGYRNEGYYYADAAYAAFVARAAAYAYAYAYAYAAYAAAYAAYGTRDLSDAYDLDYVCLRECI